MYWIVTDSTSDLPLSYLEQHEKLKVVNMSYIMDGKSYVPDGTVEGSRAIYAALRDGKVITTAQINCTEWKEHFRQLLDAGEDVLAIVFSSGLSGTCAAAMQAAEELRPKYPDRQIAVVDSLSASMGEGLLVHYVLKNRDNGMSLTDNAAWAEQNRLNMAHWFTVDDLLFLKRGGRVSAASAYLGTMIKIKPILNVDEEGHLIPREKVQGRKRSLRALADKVAEYAVAPAGQTIFISHGDCEDEANVLADMLRERLGIKEILTGYIGPIVGSHSGPGTVAVFFVGDGRKH